MPPNQRLVKDYSAFGDLTQRDVYHRHKTQVIKQDNVENYFVHLDEGDVAVDTVVERVSLEGTESKYEIFTKPSSGNLVVAANAAMVEVTAGRAVIRSLQFESTGNATVGGNLAVTGAASMSTLSTSGLATMNSLSVTGQTILGNTNIALGDTGTLSVTGNGNVNFGTSTLTSEGNVSLTGFTSIADLTVLGNSGFEGDVDMQNNSVINVTSMSRDNVRVFFDNTTQSIQAQTWAANTWSTTTTTTQDALVVNKSLSVTGDSTMSGNLTVNGTAVIGQESSPRSLTVWGNLEIKGATTNTRIESNVVQIGDLNIELGFLEVNSLANLNGAGITLGGPTMVARRPTLAYNSDLDAWQPNIDIVAKGVGAEDIARISVDGSVMSSRAEDANVFTKMTSTTFNFSNMWRFALNPVNDTIELQRLEEDEWVNKFTFVK
jgi:hypothetical protein